LVQIIEALKNNHIIHSHSVKALKEYIVLKYPNDSADRTAIIFADAVHKIIDHNIIHFDASSRISIKQNLLQEVSQKKVFSINAYEIFEVCTQLYHADESYIKNLTTWINHNQSESISTDEVVELTMQLRKPSIEPSTTSVPPILKSSTSALRLKLRELDEKTKREEKAQQELALLIEDSIQVPAVILEEPVPKQQSKVKPAHFHSIFLSRFKGFSKEALTIVLISTSLLSILGSLAYYTHSKNAPTPVLKTIEISTLNNEILPASPESYLPEYLQYKTINLDILTQWLKEKNSILAQEEYFTSIHNISKEYNINPLLMFAITGQEQAFVPNTNVDASDMANNPFNVFGSWEAYNTDIDDAARIAAKTIINLSKDCPPDEDPIKWINRKYAEDQNWHIGVTKIYTQLEKATTVDE